MNAQVNDIDLSNFDEEEVEDIILKLEKSFNFKFQQEAFRNVKTFGDLVNVFENELETEVSDDCTTQHAFYIIRAALVDQTRVSSNSVMLDSNLEEFFQLKSRRKSIKAFKKSLNVSAKLLTYPAWLQTIVGILAFVSIVLFLFDWRIAVVLLLFASLFHILAERLGNVLVVRTIRELTLLLTRENYAEVRGSGRRINKAEIFDVIVDCFSHSLAIDKDKIRRESKFSWAE